MELADDYKRWPGLVKTTKDHIVIKSPGQPVMIELSKCNTHRKTLELVIHLAEKSWVSKEILDLFVHHALDHVDKLDKQRV